MSQQKVTDILQDNKGWLSCKDIWHTATKEYYISLQSVQQTLRKLVDNKEILMKKGYVKERRGQQCNFYRWKQ